MGILEYSFSSSIIQAEKNALKDQQAVLFINLIFAIAAIIGGSLIIYLLEQLYDYQLWTYYLLLSPMPLMMAYNSVQNASLKRALEIKTFALVDLSSFIIGFITTLYLLYQGHNLFALIIGQVFRVLTSFILLIFIQGIQTLVPLALPSYLKPHYTYGKFILAEKGFGLILSYADIFLINHFFGSGLVGIYEFFKRIVRLQTLIYQKRLVYRQLQL